MAFYDSHREDLIVQLDPRKRVVRTKLAMEIADFNPLRFNEFASEGVYKCAPRTEPGKPRRFREADLIGLWWFSKMLKEGITAERAAGIACRLVNYLQEFPGGLCPYPRVTYVETTGHSFFTPTSKFVADMEEPDDVYAYQHGILVKATNFELAFVRKIIAEKIADWDNEAGDDDE